MGSPDEYQLREADHWCFLVSSRFLQHRPHHPRRLLRFHLQSRCAHRQRPSQSNCQVPALLGVFSDLPGWTGHTSHPPIRSSARSSPHRRPLRRRPLHASVLVLAQSSLRLNSRHRFQAIVHSYHRTHHRRQTCSDCGRQRRMNFRLLLLSGC